MLHPRGEDLLTIDDVAISFLAREGRDPRRVAAGLRFRDRHRLESQAAGGDFWQVAPFLGFGPVSQERAHRVHLGMAGRPISARRIDLLQDDAGLDHPQPRSAVLGGDQDRQPAAAGQRPHEFLRVPLLGIDLPPVGIRKFRTDLPDSVALLFLLVGEAEVHQRWASFRIRRARRMTASSTIWPSRAYAPRPAAAASPAEATMPRAQVTSSVVGEKTWLTVSTCDGWMSNMPPKPSSRARCAKVRSPSRSWILSHGASSGGWSPSAADARTMPARAAASAGLLASGSIPRSAERSKRPNARQRISALRAMSVTLRTPAALSMMGTNGRSPGPFAARMAVRHSTTSGAPPTLGSITASTRSRGSASRSSGICGLDDGWTRTQICPRPSRSASAWETVWRAR